MCGIAGWIDQEQNIKNKREIIEKMVKTLEKRGPDAAGIYAGEHVLLGHRRLIVVDPDGGAQPMTKKIGEHEFTLIYNGELYNTEDLRKILIQKGYAFDSHSDTEVLLTAYMHWGPSCVEYLNGIYAFGVWDDKNRSLFLARDRLGVKPLFYVYKDKTLLFASEPKALLAHPMVEPIIDEIGLMELFGLGPASSPGSGVFKDIHEVKPGHCILYTPQKMDMWEYWKLTSIPHPENLETTIEYVRSLFIDAVQRQLVADVPVCTFLSGGLDSSAISAVAAEAFRKEGKEKLHTYSIDYIDNDIHFKATEYQPDSDHYWIQRMSKFIDSEHHHIMIDTPQLVEALKDAVVANDLPGMADVDSSLYLFCKEVRKGATVALSGECADEIFGGYPWFYRPEDINSNTFPWSKAVKERAGILGDTFSHLPLEEYVAEQYSHTLQEVPKLSSESSQTHRIREISYLNLKWFMSTLLQRKDRMSMSNSLEVRVPFADHRIVEYAWNIPWDMKYCDEREKGLLRRALRGMLPEDVLNRKKSPYPKTHHPAYLKAVQIWMEEILQDPHAPILQIINVSKVKEIVRTGGTAFGKPWFGQLMTGPQLIAYLAQMDTWMRQYNVRIQ